MANNGSLKLWSQVSKMRFKVECFYTPGYRLTQFLEKEKKHFKWNINKMWSRDVAGLSCFFFFFFSLLMSPHVYFSLTELCSDGYLPWENAECKQHVWGVGWFKNPALNSKGLEVMRKSRSFSTDLLPTSPTFCPLNPGSGGGEWGPG